MPVSLFVWGASLLNADESILKHQHQPPSTNWTRRGRTEAALCRLVSGNAFNSSSGEYFLLIYLSLCLFCLWLFICLFLLSVSHGRRRKESMSPSFSLRFIEHFSICSGQVVNPTTTKGTTCNKKKKKMNECRMGVKEY